MHSRAGLVPMMIGLLLIVLPSPALTASWTPVGGRHVKNVQSSGPSTRYNSRCAACVACQLLLQDVSCCASVASGGTDEWQWLRKRPSTPPPSWQECSEVPNCIDGNGACKEWSEGAIMEPLRRQLQKEHPAMQGDWPYTVRSCPPCEGCAVHPAAALLAHLPPTCPTVVLWSCDCDAVDYGAVAHDCVSVLVRLRGCSA